MQENQEIKESETPMNSNKSIKPKLFETFTKLWVTLVLIFAIIDLQLSYILAFIGCDQIAESLSVAIVTEIIGVMAIYMIRAYFDTLSEKNHELKVNELQQLQDTIDDTVDFEEEPEEESKENEIEYEEEITIEQEENSDEENDDESVG